MSAEQIDWADVPEEARRMYEQGLKAKTVAAQYPEQFQGIVEYLALNDEMRRSGPGDFTGVDGVTSYEALVLKYGYPAMHSPRPEDVKQGTIKECYSNAYWLAQEHPDKYLYVEGYAVSSVLPIAIEHAWCVDSEGRVVDPTWEDGHAYFGIPMDVAFVSRHILETGRYGVLCNDWATDHSLLRLGFTTDVHERTGLTYAIGVGEA